jgi:enoyl-CoA hydratase
MLRRAAGEKAALELVLTGRVLSASDALDLGLIARVVPDADLEREAAALLQALAGASASARSRSRNASSISSTG